MDWIALAVAVLGLVVGGVGTTLVARLPDRKPLLTPGPSCASCGAAIRARDRVPVVSWLMLRGRCRQCGADIPAAYPVVELATAVLFVGTYLAVESAWELPAYWYLAALAVVATAIDIAHHRLPDAIVLPSYPITFALLLLALPGPGGPSDLWRAVLGGVAMLLGYFAMALINPSGMGGGDVKLAGVLGMLLGWNGWWEVLVGSFAAFFIGALISLALLVARRVDRKGHIPFGPFMFAGTYVGLLWGAEFGAWYLGG